MKPHFEHHPVSSIINSWPVLFHLDQEMENCRQGVKSGMLLYSHKLKNGFHIFLMVGKKKKNILWNVNMIQNSNHSAHKWNIIVTQSRSIIVLCIVCSCSHPAMAKLSSCCRNHRLHDSKIFAIWLFTEVVHPALEQAPKFLSTAASPSTKQP